MMDEYCIKTPEELTSIVEELGLRVSKLEERLGGNLTKNSVKLKCSPYGSDGKWIIRDNTVESNSLGKFRFMSHGPGGQYLPEAVLDHVGKTAIISNIDTVAHLKVLANQRYKVIRVMGEPISYSVEYELVLPKY